jgi:hypothetical protein
MPVDRSSPPAERAYTLHLTQQRLTCLLPSCPQVGLRSDAKNGVLTAHCPRCGCWVNFRIKAKIL